MSKIDRILKSSRIRDDFVPMDNPSSIVINHKIYFAGGMIGSNISQQVFYYDLFTKELVRLPDVPFKCVNPTILKNRGTISLINDIGEVYDLDSYWYISNTLPELHDVSRAVITDSSQFIITNDTIYEYSDNNVEKVCESENISVENYIPSIDKDIIYFKEGTYNIEKREFTIEYNGSEVSYIFYGEPVSNSDNVVIDKVSSLIVSYDTPLSTIKFKTSSSNEWIEDPINESSYSIYNISDIIINKKGIYIIENRGDKHIAHSFNRMSGVVNKELSIRRQNKSYSENINYNHTLPYAVNLNDTVSFMGNGGFYEDNSIYDNSIFQENKCIPLSLDIKDPMYFYRDGILCIGDKSNHIIFYYNKEGQYLDKMVVPIEDQVMDFKDYKNHVVLNSKSKAYMFNKKTRTVEYVINEDSIASTVDQYYRYIIKNNNNNTILIRTSFITNKEDIINLPFNISEQDKIIINTDGTQHIIYKEYNGEWEIYRIVLDE